MCYLHVFGFFDNKSLLDISCTIFFWEDDALNRLYGVRKQQGLFSESFFCRRLNWSEANLKLAMKLVIAAFLFAIVACALATTAEEDWAAFKVSTGK